MSSEFATSKRLCLVAAMVLPLVPKRQAWMRMGMDAGDVFKASLGTNVSQEVGKKKLSKEQLVAKKIYDGSYAEDAIHYLQHICRENKKLGVKLKYEFRRVAGRNGISRRWTAKSLLSTVVGRKGIYIIFGKCKWNNAIHAALMKRMRSTKCVGEELEIYSKVAKGNTKKDHAVSVRSDNNGVRLFDNACVNESVEFSVTNLANKMIDVSYCYYYDIYEKGKKSR